MFGRAVFVTGKKERYIDTINNPIGLNQLHRELVNVRIIVFDPEWRRSQTFGGKLGPIEYRPWDSNSKVIKVSPEEYRLFIKSLFGESDV